jgi:hypothetical protein
MPLNPKKFNDAHRAWKKLKAEAADYLDQRDVERLDKLFLCAGWARKPFVSRVLLKDLDRCGDILSGPLFASAKYPWPVNSNGLYMLPWLQINLTECSRIMKAEYGTGMLQVWGDQEDLSNFYLRLIPRRDVQAKYLSHENPLLNQMSGNKNFIIPTEWIDDEIAWIISGYGDLYFTSPSLFNGEPLINPDEIEQISPLDKDLYSKAKRVCQLEQRYIELATELDSLFDPSGHHLGGTFYPIQYGAEDMPAMLWSIGSELPYWQDIDGNAQIFYEKLDDGALSYSFKLSSY